ncbi:MAG TPA: sigma 54-interacting transcriptional regulator, partial [Candidatus Acidoferrum sp.]|nr:sigma 54-interacting transcriptional regulator [Candidatus Acidoferrum sp.]
VYNPRNGILMASLQDGFEESGDVQDIRLVVDTIPTLAWSAGPDGSAQFFNQRWLDYTGLSAEQALGSGWQVAIHPDELPRILETFLEALNSVKPYEVEGRFRRFDGKFRWFLFRGSPLRDRSGKVAKWYGTNTDLEDRKRAEDALRKSEERWRSVFENSAIGVALTDLNGRYLATNHVYQTIVGYTEEELRALRFLDVTHEDYREANRALITELVEGKRRQFQIEKKYRRKDGNSIWVSNNVSLVPGTARVPRFLMALSEDITQRKRAEEKLRRSEADLLEAQRLSHTGSWKHDIASGSVTVSPEVYRIFGVGTDEVKSTTEFWLNRNHPEDAKRIQELFEESEIQKTDYEANYRIVLPDGAVKHLHAIGHPIVNERDDLVEFVGTVMDVTEHHRARADLEKAIEEIKRLRDQLQNENVVLREQIDQAFMFEEIVGTSSGLQGVLSRLMKVAPTDSSVLISGETGTGKELVARAIHKRSRRSQGAFVSVNCAALAPSLISSELFGHEKGAFTGAMQRRLGRFELANGGTIFLDEIGELPLDTQVALLRVLQEREFERVGGTQPVKIDVRVIAATNRDLEAAVANGTFRPDLYYRLNVFPIHIPPLRERQDDLLMLLEYFVNRFAQKMGKHFGKIDKRTVELFRSYPWPGNIRELQNVVERSVIVSSDDAFSVDAAWLSKDPRRVTLPKQPKPADTD